MRKYFSFVIVSFCLPLANAQLQLSIQAAEASCKGSAEAFISSRKKLIFQIPVVVGGDAEVKLVPGAYQLDVLNAQNCGFKKEFYFDGNVLNLTANLQVQSGEKKERTPSGELAYVSPERAQQLKYEPLFPWWATFNNMNFMNWNYPCAWNYWGCSGTHYPSHGPFVMGKPNVYLKGPDQKNVEVRLAAGATPKILASSPAHAGNGWKFDLTADHMQTSKGRYSYLFYDIRPDASSKLNMNKAFCGDTKEVFHFMVEALKSRSYPDQAIVDFKEYWSVRLPKEHEFCAFPQTERELDSWMKLESNLKSVSWNRMAFILVPRIQEKPPRKIPVNFEMKKPSPWKDDRTPASASTHKGYEWSVGFLMD